MDWSKLLDYGTPAGWIGLGLNKVAGTPTYGDLATSAVNDISGKKGLETAAQGAREAQAQANALSQLQWQRQMQGLQEARGQTQPYLSLYDKIYGTQMAGHQTPVGGMNPNMMGGPPGAGSGATTPAPYNQSMAPRMVAPGKFLPAGRVAGDAALQDRLNSRVAPGAAPIPGLPNGNTYNPYIPGGSDTMATNDVLSDYLRQRGAIR